jgi:hypothetical protein
MAALTQLYRPTLAHIAFIKKRDAFIERFKPRRCMMVSVGLILAGMCLPMLMILGLLPATLFLAFVGFALTAAGGGLALFYCGEI